METSFRICLIQANISDNFTENKNSIEKFSKASLIYNPDIIVLPSDWAYSSDLDITSQSLEENENDVLNFLKSLSIDLNTVVIGGSIPEKDGENYYNTCYCLNGNGEIIGKHRQVHFLGNSAFSKGNNFTTIELPFAKIGLGLNDDLRFMEYSQLLKKEGAQILIFPNKYSHYAENNHYNIIMQGRALDNNAYVICCNAYIQDNSKITLKNSGYSQIVDPYGQILISSLHQEGVIYAVIDKQLISKIEESIPTLVQKKHELYNLVKLN